MKNFPVQRGAPRSSWALLAGIIVVAVVLRFLGESESMILDEIASVHFASVPAEVLWSDWMIRETNPPLFYALLGAWTEVAGSSDFAMRILPIIFSCAGIVLIYLLGRRLFNDATGLTAAALAAVSVQNVFFGQQVRAYSLGYTAALAVILSCVLLVDLYRSNDRKGLIGAWALFVISNCVALYSHTTLFALPLLANLWLLWAFLRGRLLTSRVMLHAASANLVILAVWAWWVRITLVQLMMPRLNFSWIVTPSIPYAIRLTLEAWFPWDLGPARFVAALGAVLVVAWAVYKWRERASLPLFIVVFAPAIFFLVSQKTPIYVPRTLFWMSGPFLLLVAAGLCALPTRRSVSFAVSAALAVLAVNYALWLRTGTGEPWAEVVRAISRQNPAALVLVEGRGAGLALERYCEQQACKLQIATLRTPKDERWTSGFDARINVDPKDASAMIRKSGSAYFVNWLGIPADDLIGPVLVERRVNVPGLSDGIPVVVLSASETMSSHLLP